MVILLCRHIVNPTLYNPWYRWLPLTTPVIFRRPFWYFICHYLMYFFVIKSLLCQIFVLIEVSLIFFVSTYLLKKVEDGSLEGAIGFVAVTRYVVWLINTRQLQNGTRNWIYLSSRCNRSSTVQLLQILLRINKIRLTKRFRYNMPVPRPLSVKHTWSKPIFNLIHFWHNWFDIRWHDWFLY